MGPRLGLPNNLSAASNFIFTPKHGSWLNLVEKRGKLGEGVSQAVALVGHDNIGPAFPDVRHRSLQAGRSIELTE